MNKIFKKSVIGVGVFGLVAALGACTQANQPPEPAVTVTAAPPSPTETPQPIPSPSITALGPYDENAAGLDVIVEDTWNELTSGEQDAFCFAWKNFPIEAESSFKKGYDSGPGGAYVSSDEVWDRFEVFLVKVC